MDTTSKDPAVKLCMQAASHDRAQRLGEDTTTTQGGRVFLL